MQIRIAIVGTIALLVAACSTAPERVAKLHAASVNVRLLAFNDFHGALRTPSFGITDESGKMVRAGGAAHLATAIQQNTASPIHTVVVGAGDLIGATPLITSLFADEPTIETLTAIGLQLSSVGNHEFDRGWRELQRHQRGGCAEGLTCAGEPYKGAGFTYLAANVRLTANGQTLFPAYQIRDIDGVKVAFLGLVLEGTPTIVPATALAGLTFEDEVDVINKLVPEVQRLGAEAIVVLIHEGGRSSGHYNDKTCPNFAGPIVAIAEKVSPAVDVIVSGHSHQAYICRVAGKLVTSAASNGRLLTRIDLTIDRQSRDVTASHADNIIVSPDIYPADPRIEARIARYAERSAPLENRVVGRVAGEISMMANAAGEIPMGSVVADAQLAATRAAGAQIAFMNRGGVRAPLLSRRDGGAVTFADIFTVQPFANMLTTMDLSGAQILKLLEQQWQADSSAPLRILQVSSNFSYQWDDRQPLGQKVVPGSVRIDGQALDVEKIYRITCNSFIAEGAEFFSVFTQGKNRVVGMVDVQALEDYVKANSPIMPPASGRIVRRDR